MYFWQSVMKSTKKEKKLQSLPSTGKRMIALYLTQDSFGTAANVSGDNAIAVFVDWYYQSKVKKEAA